MLPKKYASYLRYFNWYLSSAEIPLCVDLNESLPLPNLANATIMWPDSYSWSSGSWRLNLVKKHLSAFVPVQGYNVKTRGFRWHELGGFPVPQERLGLLGTAMNPKDANDIRGEIFEIRKRNSTVKCAYDYSDYPVISTEILNQVDLYFKCVMPAGEYPPNVIPIGYFPKKANLLAFARKAILRDRPRKKFDVYGRFGNWTDNQQLRQCIVDAVTNSPLNFCGGFDLQVYPAYLRELVEAKMALHLPGQGPLSYRIAEAMALGALVVSPKPQCVLPEELKEGVHYARIKADGSDVVKVCQEFVKNPARRQRIVDEAMVYFDRNFSPQSIARRILRTAMTFTN
jgi:glycosyltransferase involved in cell wall biosynthesis